MGDNTKIEWADSTWNAIRGCSRVSAGCANCYAEGMAARFSDPGQWGHGLAERRDGRGRWTGKVTLDEKALLKPLSWRKPRRIFVTSIGDPFHLEVPDEWLDRLFAVMALARQHTFQMLTKRPERMREYVVDVMERRSGHIADAAETALAASGARRDIAGAWEDVFEQTYPLPNVWLGTSVEDQATADERIPHLLATPAALRFISAEPLLGPGDLTKIRTTCGAMGGHAIQDDDAGYTLNALVRDGGEEDSDDPHGLFHDAIDWVIAGGESGPEARPMHPDWARDLRDQCAAAGTPFMFKGWGGWRWGGRTSGGWFYYPSIVGGRQDGEGSVFTPASPDHDWGDGHVAVRVGKKAAGRLLDGREHNDMPKGV